jgi:DNA polymerase III subunit epsilon
MKFINAELEWAGLAQIPMTRAIDTVIMARKKYPGQPASLDALCRRFNIDLSARTKHGALLDSELLCDVYLELMGGRQQGLGLKASGADDVFLEEASAIFSGHTGLPGRQFLPSSEELAAHERMLKKVKNALWLENAG